VTEDILQIVSAGSDAVQKAEQTFFTDASQLLKEINAIVQKGQCMEAAGAKQIQDQIYKLLEGLNPLYRFSSCWRGLGHGVTTSLESLTDIQLYDYQKQCTLLINITPNTPVSGPNGILEVYAQGQLYAAEYNCIGETAGAPAFQDFMTKEWVWWGVQYNSWKNMQTNKQKLETGVTPFTDDPSCGTPVECYAKAIKALNAATEKIAPLQAAVSANNQSIQKNTATINVLNGDRTLTNTSTVEANGNDNTVVVDCHSLGSDYVLMSCGTIGSVDRGGGFQLGLRVLPISDHECQCFWAGAYLCRALCGQFSSHS